MDYFAGLDVSVKDTSVCIVDDTGRIILDIPLAVVLVAISIAVIRRKSALLRFWCPSISGIRKCANRNPVFQVR